MKKLDKKATAKLINGKLVKKLWDILISMIMGNVNSTNFYWEWINSDATLKSGNQEPYLINTMLIIQDF
jgi:hypothetical protein